MYFRYSHELFYCMYFVKAPVRFVFVKCQKMVSARIAHCIYRFQSLVFINLKSLEVMLGVNLYRSRKSVKFERHFHELFVRFCCRLFEHPRGRYLWNTAKSKNELLVGWKAVSDHAVSTTFRNGLHCIRFYGPFSKRVPLIEVTNLGTLSPTGRAMIRPH